MKLQIAGFCAASLTLFTAISTGLVHTTAQQLWNPEIAHAAKITTTLLKSKSRLFSRTVRPVSQLNQLVYSLIPDATRSNRF